MGPEYVKIFVDIFSAALSSPSTQEASMRWWERQIGGPMRGRIIALLRRGASTVEELAAALGVTDNAVRAHLQRLEREGVVRPTGNRQGPGAGKPATTYHVAMEAEASLSSAYAPVLTALLQTLAERTPPEELDALMREVGQRLGPSEPNRGTLESRVRAAAALLTSLGSELDVERTPDGYLLRGFACPLAVAVRSESSACHAVEELVGTVVGAPVRERCDRSVGARCRFEIRASA
jgi:predicted ArsR family transcriptional regulator